MKNYEVIGGNKFFIGDLISFGFGDNDEEGIVFVDPPRDETQEEVFVVIGTNSWKCYPLLEVRINNKIKESPYANMFLLQEGLRDEDSVWKIKVLI